MPADPKTISRSWRRYLRFSVRGLIVLVLVIGLWLGWIVRSAHIQRDAVAAIEGAGGQVIYDFEWKNGNPMPGGKRSTAGRLADLIGVDYFGHVTDVWLYPSSTDADVVLAQVGRLAGLERLRLSQSSCSDAALAHLEGLSELSLLYLNNTRITDAGLSHLKSLTSLEVLDLHDTRVSDAGLAYLKRLTNLSGLYLSETQITDLGLAHLKGLTKLESLDLDRTRVTDIGLTHLEGLANLRPPDLREFDLEPVPGFVPSRRSSRPVASWCPDI